MKPKFIGVCSSCGFVDDEFDESGKPNYRELDGSRWYG
jgi:hypothetical protein